MTLVARGHIDTGQEQLDTGIRDLEIVTGPQGSFLYAATGPNGGLSVYELHDDGQPPSLVDQTYFTDLTAGVMIDDLQDVTLEGNARMIFGGEQNGALVGYDLQSGGTLGASNRTQLPGSGGIAAIASTVLSSGQTVIYGLDAQSGELGTYLDDSSAGSGAGLTRQDGAAPLIGLSGAVVMQTASVGTSQFLLVADNASQGVASYRISDRDGTLTAADSLGAADGIGINTPTALDTITAYGETWAVLGAAGSDTLGVMRLGTDGSLTATDQLLDTRDTRFGGVQAVDMIEVAGRVWVIAGGADDGLSLFTLLPDGRLVYRESLAADTAGGDLGLENVAAIDAVEMDGGIDIFVASASTPGLSEFLLPLDNPGQVLSGAGALSGTGGDDLLMSTATGSERIDGKAGDDILVAGSGAAVLHGGAGADIFVLQPVDATVHIEDFRPGTDRLDLSMFAMLRSPDQLSVTATASGARIDWGSTGIVLDSTTGQPLDTAQIWPDGSFSAPDRLLPDPGPPSGMMLRGTDSKEYLDGGAGDDTVYAGAGNDNVQTGQGNDLLYGEDGRDTLSAGSGNDTVWSGDGHDSVPSSSGDNTIHGENGRDTLWGGDGDDLITGDGGDDLIGGDAGNDTLWGGRGADEAHGDDGDDLIEGEGGDDVLRAGPGRDTVYGGRGNDDIHGDDDRDFLWGKDGADLIHGGNGNDQLGGGKGRDTLRGGKAQDDLNGDGGKDTVDGGDGRDTVHGGRGDDRVWGGRDDDLLYGDDGNDILTGEEGADVFVFAPDHGNDRITDLTLGEDLIRLDIAGLDYAGLIISASGADMVIDTGEGTITVEGMAPWQIGTDDFQFL